MQVVNPNGDLKLPWVTYNDFTNDKHQLIIWTNKPAAIDEGDKHPRYATHKVVVHKNPPGFPEGYRWTGRKRVSSVMGYMDDRYVSFKIGRYDCKEITLNLELVEDK